MHFELINLPPSVHNQPHLPSPPTHLKHIPTLSPRKAKMLRRHGDSLPIVEIEMCDLEVPQPFSQLLETPSFTTPIHSSKSCNHYRSLPFITVHRQCSHSLNPEAELWINTLNRQLSINEDYQSTLQWLFLAQRYQNSEPWFASMVLSRDVTALVSTLNEMKHHMQVVIGYIRAENHCTVNKTNQGWKTWEMHALGNQSTTRKVQTTGVEWQQ